MVWVKNELENITYQREKRKENIQRNPYFKTTPLAHKKWSYMTGDLLSEVQIYRNVGLYSY